MKFGLRTPSLNKRIAAKLSVKRYVRQNLGFKAPRGFGWLTNPKKAVYNKVYNKTSTGCILVIVAFMGLTFTILWITFIFLK